MKTLACFGKLPVECRIVPPTLFPQRLKLSLTLTEIFVHDFPIRHIKSQSTKNLLEVQGREGFGDSLRGFSPQKCVDD